MNATKLTPTDETETESAMSESHEGATSDTAATEAGSHTQSRAEAHLLGISPAPARWRRRLVQMLVFLALPLLAMLAGASAGWMKYEDATIRAADDARVASVRTASDATIAMLSYTPDTVEAKLTASASRLTGPFRQSYENLVKTVVVPGAKQKQISATATVPAAASVSATENSAVVLVFVDQSITIGTDAPTNTASAVEVTLTKVGYQWLISGFEPR